MAYLILLNSTGATQLFTTTPEISLQGDGNWIDFTENDLHTRLKTLQAIVSLHSDEWNILLLCKHPVDEPRLVRSFNALRTVAQAMRAYYKASWDLRVILPPGEFLNMIQRFSHRELFNEFAPYMLCYMATSQWLNHVDLAEFLLQFGETSYGNRWFFTKEDYVLNNYWEFIAISRALKFGQSGTYNGGRWRRDPETGFVFKSKPGNMSLMGLPPATEMALIDNNLLYPERANTMWYPNIMFWADSREMLEV